MQIQVSQFVFLTGQGILLRNSNDLKARAINSIDEVRALNNQRRDREGARCEQREEGEECSFELFAVNLLSRH